MKLSKERRSGCASRGSQLQLQNMVNKAPISLNKMILDASPKLRKTIDGDITWLSPLEKNDYLEYQDQEFLEAIGYPQLEKDLLDFWPAGGPVWDGLAFFSVKGKDKRGVILVEAKSHTGELKSGGCGAGQGSRAQISNTLNEVKTALNVPIKADWMGKHYQHANRLAHLYFLSIKHNITAWLVYAYFVNDIEQGGPTEEKGWDETIDTMKHALGIKTRHLLSDYIVNVFPDIKMKEKDSSK